MNNKLKLAAALSAALAAGALFSPLNSASAGHTNFVLTTSLKGENEEPAVNPEGNHGNVGDRDGRGKAFVFGIDGDPTTLC